MPLDGRMIAFDRGSRDFLSADQVDVKMLRTAKPDALRTTRGLIQLGILAGRVWIAQTALEPPNGRLHGPVLGGDPSSC